MGYWLLTCPPDGLSLTSNRFSSFVIRFFRVHTKKISCAREAIFLLFCLCKDTT
jgi:hypothetical protein